MSQNTTVKIRWISPTTPTDITLAEERILSELDELLNSGLDDPMNLIFHTIFLEDNMDGPNVTISPSDDGEGMDAYYDADAAYSDLGEIDAGPFEGKRVEVPASLVGRVLDETDDNQH